MSFRVLAVMPVAVAGAFAGAWGLSPTASHALVLDVEIGLAKVLGVGGAAAAALAFRPGDYLRRAWWLLGGSIALLLARDLVDRAGAGELLEGLLAIGGNATSVLGVWLLARAWRVAGLEDDERGDARLLVASAAVALLVTAWPIAHAARALARGDLEAIAPLASCLGDAAVITLLGPLARTTLALEGGVLRWPWLFLTINGALWLAFDLAYDSSVLFGATSRLAEDALGLMRALPPLMMLSAGLAQRRVLAGVTP